MANNTSQSILGKLTKAVESLADLRIVTCVGDVRIAISDDNKPSLSVPASTDGAEGIYTSINLVSGDILNAISERYATTGDTWIHDFHKEQVATGREIVATNVEAIKQLADSAGQKIGALLNSTDSERTANANTSGVQPSVSGQADPESTE